MEHDFQPPLRTAEPGVAMTLPDLEPLEALARAYDREDASQRGEPDPWKDAEDDAEWVSERLACAQVAEAAYRAASSTVPEAGKAVDVSVQTMRLSDGRSDYFVAFKCGGREVTPHVFRERYKAEYHVALYKWLFGQEDKEPNVVEFSADDWPALASVPAPSGAEPSEQTCPSCGGNGVNPEGIMRPDGGLADCEICNGRGTVPAPQAVPAEDVAGLVERLNKIASAYEAEVAPMARETIREAAAMLAGISEERDRFSEWYALSNRQRNKAEAENASLTALGIENLHWGTRGVFNLSSSMMAAADAFTDLCSPDNIRALLDELSRLRLENDRLAGLESESDEAADIVAEMNAEIVRLREERDMWKGRAEAAVMVGRSLAGARAVSEREGQE